MGLVFAIFVEFKRHIRTVCKCARSFLANKHQFTSINNIIKGKQHRISFVFALAPGEVLLFYQIKMIRFYKILTYYLGYCAQSWLSSIVDKRRIVVGLSEHILWMSRNYLNVPRRYDKRQKDAMCMSTRRGQPGPPMLLLRQLKVGWAVQGLHGAMKRKENWNFYVAIDSVDNEMKCSAAPCVHMRWTNGRRRTMQWCKERNCITQN